MESVEPYNEKELLTRLQKGDATAFTQLYHQYSGQIYYNVLRMVKDENSAEEIVQDLFIRVWQKRNLLKEDTNFAAFLYRAGQNMVIDFFRKLQRDRLLYDNFKALATESYSHIEEDLLYRESEELLNEAMESLSPQLQKVYKHCKIDGLSYKEAAAIMGISTHTVKEYLSKANNAVQTYMIDHHSLVLIPFLLFLPITR